MLVLSHQDVLRALPPQACAEAMAAVLAEHARGGSFMPLRSVMAPPGAAGFLGLMPGWRTAQPNGKAQHGAFPRGDDPPSTPRRGASSANRAAVFALKAVCIVPGNPARGLDAHQGLVTLFDGETGQPSAVLDASAITEIRTAAVTAVATRVLSRPDARTLAILGAGTQARAHLAALLPVREFARVRVYAPTEAHARAMVDQAKDAGAAAELRVAPSAQDALRDADVVVTATSSREPVLRRDWLKPGAHLNAVGASTPRSRELDTATIAASALFCDSRESLRHEAGEFQLAIAEGLITGEDHVRAELGEVLAGTADGRRGDDELTLFRSLGLAIEDLAAAETAVAAARAVGLGTEVPL